MSKIIVLDLLKVSRDIKNEKMIFASSPRYQLSDQESEDDCDIFELVCLGDNINEFSENLLISLHLPSQNFHPNVIRFDFPDYETGKILKPLRGLVARKKFSPCEMTHIKENFKKAGFKN